MVGCLLSAVIAGRGRAVKAVGGAHTLRRCMRGSAHTNNATSAMSEEIDAANKRVLEPQYGHNRFGLLRKPRHHRTAPGQPETTE